MKMTVHQVIVDAILDTDYGDPPDVVADLIEERLVEYGLLEKGDT